MIFPFIAWLSCNTRAVYPSYRRQASSRGPLPPHDPQWNDSEGHPPTHFPSPFTLGGLSSCTVSMIITITLTVEWQMAGVLLSCTSLCCMFLETCVAPHLLSWIGAHGCGFLLHRWKQDYKACQAESSSNRIYSTYSHFVFVCGRCACVAQVESTEHYSEEQQKKPCCA